MEPIVGLQSQHLTPRSTPVAARVNDNSVADLDDTGERRAISHAPTLNPNSRSDFARRPCRSASAAYSAYAIL